MSTIKKPIMLDETGQELVKALRTQNVLIGMANGLPLGALASWKDVQSMVQQRVAHHYFQIGDQFVIPWKDTVTGKSYAVPLDVVHFEDVVLQNGSVTPGMFLQWHYATPVKVQFDASENAIATGTFSSDCFYYYCYDGTNYTFLVEGLDYKIGDAIPKSGAYYKSAIRDPSCGICQYGYNSWKDSAIRQFLNSKAEKNAWWQAAHVGDQPPAQLSTHAGFLTGFDEEFLSVIGPVAVDTLHNERDGTDDEEKQNRVDRTFDTFFLPSLAQIWAEEQVSGTEGTPFQYWIDATGTAEPNVYYVEGQNPAYITYDVSTRIRPEAVRLRSAGYSTTGITWALASGGYINNPKANKALACTPVCVIH